MTVRISTKTATFSDDGYCSVLSFADDPMSPVNYVILSVTNVPDEQDIRLDLAGVHIETSVPDLEGYNLVRDIRETDAGLIISLAAEAPRRPGIEDRIEVELKDKLVDGARLGDVLRRFNDRLNPSG